MDRDRVGSLVEKDAVIAGAQAQEAIELAAQGFYVAGAGLGVAVDRLQNVQSVALVDGADLAARDRVEVDGLH